MVLKTEPQDTQTDTQTEPQEKGAPIGRTVDARTCNGGQTFGNLCVPNTSIQKGDVFKITVHDFSSYQGRTVFVREVQGTCNVAVNGVLTQISPINSMACGNCCNVGIGGVWMETI